MSNGHAKPIPTGETVELAQTLELAQPSYTVSFHRDGKHIGTFDFNQSPVTFTGDADASAKVFIDWVIQYFSGHVGDVLKDAAFATITAERDELQRKLTELESTGDKDVHFRNG